MRTMAVGSAAQLRTVAVGPTARTASAGHLRRWTGCPTPGCLIHPRPDSRPRPDIHPQLEGDLEDDEK
ncbi:hypothetical protein [Streptomyces sp. NPDC050546]|uniref:hypothetical protein n=1 Tax=Streptomyces sp. NPDC050546 TaxID=3365628 RepID=UPI003799A8A5